MSDPVRSVSYNEEHTAESVPDGAKWQFDPVPCGRCGNCEAGDDCWELKHNSLWSWIFRTASTQEGFYFIDQTTGKHWRTPRATADFIGDLEYWADVEFSHRIEGSRYASWRNDEIVWEDIPTFSYIQNMQRRYVQIPPDIATCPRCDRYYVEHHWQSETPFERDGIGRLVCRRCWNGMNLRGAKDEYVYVIRGVITKRFKIGISKNPILRISDIASSGGQTIDVMRIFSTASALSIEKHAHEIADADRIIGEWFRPGPGFVDAVLYLASECQDVTPFMSGAKNINTRNRLLEF